jgi:G3E family GTPase
MPEPETLPTIVLTGFLGSGKTTLLRRALVSPALSDTAVVINEIGEIAIDHHLVDFVEGSVIELPGGCLCCAVREDLARTLRGLIERREAGEIRGFRRIVVETTGLADPAPILYTLGADPMLDHCLNLAGVVTLVDAMSGAGTLDHFPEAARQVALADRLVISKTDLAPFGGGLAARLDRLNERASRIIAAEADDPGAVLFGAGSGEPPRLTQLPIGSRLPSFVMAGRVPAIHMDPWDEPGDDDVKATAREWGETAPPVAVHSHGIDAFAVTLGREISRFDFARALGGLARERGGDLLRVKGIVSFADRPGRPALVQAAQHALFAPEWLTHWPADWPDDDHRSRLVFVVHDIPRAEILAHFAFAEPRLYAAEAGG